MRVHLAILAFLVCSLPLTAQSSRFDDPDFIALAQGNTSVGMSTFGTDATAYSVSHWGFHPETSDTAYTWDEGRWALTPTGSLGGAHVSLPGGASIIGLGIDGCDGSATGGMVAVLAAQSSSAGTAFAVAALGSGTVEVPGCANFFAPVIVPHTVDNSDNSYYIEWRNGGSVDGSTKLRSARVFYQLQVSPAPATASFGDVPVTHPLHQFVEALAAAGITAGCGGGDFCPDAPLTRGQMAVMLAKALGLHWF